MWLIAEWLSLVQSVQQCLTTFEDTAKFRGLPEHKLCVSCFYRLIKITCICMQILINHSNRKCTWSQNTLIGQSVYCLDNSNQLNFYFVTSRQYWSGIAKLKNVNINLSTKFIWNFRNFLCNKFFPNFLTDWRREGRTDGRMDWLTDGRTDGLTDWLTDWLTYNALGKHTLFNVTSSWDVPFLQSQQLPGLHHSSTNFVLLGTPFLSPLPHKLQFTIRTLWLQCKTQVSAAVLSGALLLLGILLKVLEVDGNNA